MNKYISFLLVPMMLLGLNSNSSFCMRYSQSSNNEIIQTNNTIVNEIQEAIKALKDGKYNTAKQTCIKFLMYVSSLFKITMPQRMNDFITRDVRKLLHDINPIIRDDVFTGNPLLDFVNRMECIDVEELDNTHELEKFLNKLYKLSRIACDRDELDYYDSYYENNDSD